MNNVTRLHFEINEFCHYMAPTPKEDEMRRSVVEKVREVVASKWTNAKVEIYGSFSTGNKPISKEIGKKICFSGVVSRHSP